MRIITKVEVKECPDRNAQVVVHFPDQKRIYSFDNYYSSSSPPVNFTFEKEVVTPRLFVNEEGERYLIGMTKEVQDQIGLPFEAFENIQKENKQLRDAIYDLSFWQRLKFLFLGKKFFKNVRLWH